MRRAGLIALSLAALMVAVGASATTILSAPPSAIALTADWQPRDCGTFRIRTPAETILHRDGRFSGVLRDRRFTLTYTVGLAVDGAIGLSGQDYREVPVEVGGRPAVLRTAEFPGAEAPYFLQLVVPDAVKGRDGRWLALEIHGWFANRDRRWLGELVVRSVDLAPPYDRSVKPLVPRRDPPAFAVTP